MTLRSARLSPRLPYRFVVAAFMLAVVLCAGAGVAVTHAQITPLPLLAGWNNFAYLGPAQPVLAGLSAIDGKYDAVWQFDAGAQQYRGFNPKAPETSDFTDLTEGGTYWIHMLQAATLPIGQPGVAVDRTTLAKGWNNVAQTAATGSAATVLGAFNVSFSAIWHWNAGLQKWELFDPSAPQASDFQTMVQGQAYFVQVTGGTTTAPVGCYGFTSYQPQIGEIADALSRAGNNLLLTDPSFTLPAAHVALDGSSGATVSGYIPPDILKAIAWLESNWHQADMSVPRGSQGKTIVSKSCAYGVLQDLSDMSISQAPTNRQTLIGTDYLHNIAASAQLLLGKWNFAPQYMPIAGRRDPHVIEDWYYAIWAYYCYGDVCGRYGIHNNPDDPTLKWPRPMYNSPEYLAGNGAFTIADYPYQELVFGLLNYPPVVDGVQLWSPIQVQLPPHGSVGFPTPRNVNEASAHVDGGPVLPAATPWPTPSPSPSPTPPPTATPPAATPTPGPGRPSGNGTYFPPVGQ